MDATFVARSPDASFGGTITIWPNQPCAGALDLSVESVKGPSVAVALTAELARHLATNLDLIARRST